MKRLLDWIGGALGGIAVYRLLQRWLGGERTLEPEPAGAPDERAEELRARLAETREEPPDEPAPLETIEERRRRVHEEGRAAIDEMGSE